jgi:fructose-1,6-bisphosphatase/inositol monophosphatase family enzyme
MRSELSEQRILDRAHSIMIDVIRQINTKVNDDPDRYLNLLWNTRLKKYLLQIDYWADDAASSMLSATLGNSLIIRGEESSLEKVADGERYAVLLDMVDGTDLLQRNLGNWCSAMVFFNPAKEEITCALIGTPHREVYCMTASNPKTYVRLLTEIPDQFVERPVHVQKSATTAAKSLNNASVAFYGQKASSFLSIYRQKRFFEALGRIEETSQKHKGTTKEPLFRIYNLAGNPMMMQVIEGNIDAVIECKGQLCHDVVPGFAIALCAGAHIIDLDTKKPMTLQSIGRALRNPSARFRYVLASNATLARSLAALLD